MREALPGLVAGLFAGAVMARGTVCLNAGVRGALFERRPRIVRIFALAFATQLLLLPLLDATGTDPLSAALDAGIPTLLPGAQLVGGALFGVGMALAGGCIAGILWKTGAGSVATALAIAGFAAGELLARGALAPVLEDLDGAVAAPSESSVHDLLGVPYAVLALPLGAAALVLLLRRSLSGAVTGLALGAVAALAWVAADAAGYGYGLGFVGTADTIRDAVVAGDAGALDFQVFLALGVVAGAAVALRGPLRLPDATRAGRALAGGVLMGVGANAAHGCNIGHGLTGLPLLSLGSLLATATMVAGAALAWRLLLRPFPTLRGIERPEPDW